MPRKRRLAKGRAVALELNEWLECALLDGQIWEFMFSVELTDDVLRQAWAVYGADLLAKWVAERPGTRPWAWWKFSAPAPRSETEAETEAAYLARHGLLTDAEREALAAVHAGAA